MKRFPLSLILLLLATQAAFSQKIYTTKTGRVDFVSNAPLEVIKASSAELHGAINLDERTFVFTIQNKSFKGFNSPLQQEHFYENYMEIQVYPASTFEGKFIEQIDPDLSSEQEIRAKGILYIHGMEQERIIRGTLITEPGKLVISASFSVPLEDHKIKIPRVVYQKIAEAIDVSIEAELFLKTP